MPKQIQKKPKKQISQKVKTGARRVKRSTKQVLIPNEQNDYRPLLIRRYGLVVLMMIVLSVQMLNGVMMGPSVLGAHVDVSRTQLLVHTNNERVANNKAALTMNDTLGEAAAMKANDMFVDQYWSHTAPDGTGPWVWFAEVGYDYERAGENLARGFDSSAGVVTAWMDSPTHRENVLGDFTEVGFAVQEGVLNGKSTTLVVALYGKPATISMGASAGEMVLSQVEHAESIMAVLRRGMMMATPSLIFVLCMLGIAAAVTVMAHTYRKKLPKNLQKSWYRHHALIKFAFIMVLALGAVASFGGGMI